MRQPSLFISHGAPSIAIERSPAHDFLKQLGSMLSKPDAIVMISAHYEAENAEVVSDALPDTIYDFGGFAQELYQIKYKAKGSPALASRVRDLLIQADIPTSMNSKRGFDHGAWTPLYLAFPEADIPVVQVSINSDKDAAYHYALGEALAPLRDDNVLIIGSGHITHNLRSVFGTLQTGRIDSAMQGKVEAFTQWFSENLTRNAKDELLDWKEVAPFARDNHPTDDHLMPIFAAYGAGGIKPVATRIHSSVQLGSFAHEVWRFD